MSIKTLLTPPAQGARTSAGLLILRLVAGSALMLHGLPKLSNPFGWMGPDSWAPGILQALAVLSEAGGGLALVLGLLTPLASLGVASTMAVAAMTHANMGHPFVGKGGSFELPLTYLAVAVLVLCAGPGRLAVDSLLFSSTKK